VSAPPETPPGHPGVTTLNETLIIAPQTFNPVRVADYDFTKVKYGLSNDIKYKAVDKI
jgi:hypothetical protein